MFFNIEKSTLLIFLSLNFILGFNKPLFLGYDFGTSGVRICLIDENYDVKFENSFNWKDKKVNVNDALAWKNAQYELLESIPLDYRKSIHSICSSGTSASCLIYDINQNKISREPRMYDYNVLKENENIGKIVMNKLNNFCPNGNAANAPTSTLAKVLAWQEEEPFKSTERLVHQADYLSHTLTLHDEFTSEWHNSLKLGYDVHELVYPTWLYDCIASSSSDSSDSSDSSNNELLPHRVVAPGTYVGQVHSSISSRYDLNENCQVVSGTTDSIAAFIASGANQIGQAVSSLGSTLAIKLLSSTYADDSTRGVYSHRLNHNQWLVGGASNVGCAILRKLEFDTNELIELSKQIDPDTDIDLNYYPLCNQGERFPINDASKQPILEPIPTDRADYLKGILQSIAYIEKKGYDVLLELGADQVTEVITAGGGSTNEMWTAMRQRVLQVPTTKADNIDAAFGAAKLAIQPFEND